MLKVWALGFGFGCRGWGSEWSGGVGLGMIMIYTVVVRVSFPAARRTLVPFWGSSNQITW